MYRNQEHYIDRTASEAIRRANRQRKGHSLKECPWGDRLTYRIGEVMDMELLLIE